MKNKILLHACCATCCGYPLHKLFDLGFEPVIYFYNPNISPEAEYLKRLNELKLYLDKKNIEYIEDKYEPEFWAEYIKGLEQEPEKGKRCEKCFELRLLKTAKKTKELNLESFTTTLTVSPHKNSDMIFEIANKIARDENIKFLELNFKKENGFLKTMQIAKEENFYRQNYCGCEYSIR